MHHLQEKMRAVELQLDERGVAVAGQGQDQGEAVLRKCWEELVVWLQQVPT